QKQEGRFLQGTSGSESAGGTGGASTVTLTTSHLPAHNHGGSVTIASAGDHRHQVDNHAHTQPPHVHTYERFTINANASSKSAEYTNDDYKWQSTNTSSNGGENTGGSAPNTNTTGLHGHSATLSINNTGSGSSFSIIPLYLKVNIWKRLT
ncbi:hypothetical protein, partial [Cetobacterium sp. ZOR0034]|uniref:phage baseplate protein n=1 Tax=Cetobacterium sp. ZOR0034 TaxID=1339239 RepID=UPI00064764CE